MHDFTGHTSRDLDNDSLLMATTLSLLRDLQVVLQEATKNAAITGAQDAFADLSKGLADLMTEFEAVAKRANAAADEASYQADRRHDESLRNPAGSAGGA